ncbi:nuclear transport factor 2 family protein [Kribbella sp. NPDC051770]|uniref:nuclear transport factor 2 family protein n=1 Tax=Kribbella sp. NPDC051770 TaxID=3155413 RepID=UPI0034353A75
MTTTEHTRAVAERYFSTMNARDWSAFGTLLTDDVRYELPQTGEQITGRDRYLSFNQDYPGDWRLEVTRLLADDANASASLLFTVGDQQMVALVFLELRDGLVARVTDFWPEPYDAPAGREHLTQQGVSERDRFTRS